jgi:glycosyltransferase involved in cell wall biosynthesis
MRGEQYGINSKPRILFLCTQMEAAGVQTRATKMRAALEKRGIDAWVIFLYKKRPSYQVTEKVFYLFEDKPRGPLELLKLLYCLQTTIYQIKPTAVVGMAHFASPIAAILGLLNGIKYRVATQTMPYSRMPMTARWLDWLCGCCRIYTSNICASHAIFKVFSNFPVTYQKALRIVVNGIDLKVSTLSKNQARRRFGLPLNVPLILNCGRLSAEKNQLFILDLLPNLPNTHLAILGEGELKLKLLRKCKENNILDRVHFIGERPHEEIANFFRSGDVFVFPSLYEAFGLALVEAMASGLPVVASDQPALVEVIGNAGLNLPLGQINNWVAALQKIQSTSTLVSKMGFDSRNRAQFFDFEPMLQGFFDACTELKTY